MAHRLQLRHVGIQGLERRKDGVTADRAQAILTGRMRDTQRLHPTPMTRRLWQLSRASLGVGVAESRRLH